MSRRRPTTLIRAEIATIKARIAKKRAARQRTADDDARLRMLVRELLGAEVRERKAGRAA